MIIVNVARDFATVTGFRTYSDGPKSGQEFFDEILKGKFQQSIKEGVKLKIEMDGTEGYTSSFINEAFRRLAEKFGPEVVWSNLIIEYEESPRIIKKIKSAIYGKASKK